MAHEQRLTPREREVLRLAGGGRTNTQIARELGITRNGVRFHLKEIHSKLRTDGDRDQLVSAAGRETREPVMHLDRTYAMPGPSARGAGRRCWAHRPQLIAA